MSDPLTPIDRTALNTVDHRAVFLRCSTNQTVISRGSVRSVACMSRNKEVIPWRHAAGLVILFEYQYSTTLEQYYPLVKVLIEPLTRRRGLAF
jgi:hypothetical protein